ncbi:MAG: GLPGLI family protein [Muribaculaceae bacterium]|nr:GLPGLI family protein [Muribaculaceae bacterium]
MAFGLRPFLFYIETKMKDFAFICASIRIIQRRKAVGMLLMFISALSALAEERAEVVVSYDCTVPAFYHGRHWKAWFAPEIPVVAGPWKLRGLPGLILKAESEGGFSFVATGLEPTDRLITPMYSPGDYKTTDRKNALKMNEYYFNNQEAIIKAQNGGEGKITYQDDQGNEIAAPKYDGKKLSLEPDYK